MGPSGTQRATPAACGPANLTGAFAQSRQEGVSRVPGPASRSHPGAEPAPAQRLLLSLGESAPQPCIVCLSKQAPGWGQGPTPEPWSPPLCVLRGMLVPAWALVLAGLWVRPTKKALLSHSVLRRPLSSSVPVHPHRPSSGTAPVSLSLGMSPRPGRGGSSAPLITSWQQSGASTWGRGPGRDVGRCRLGPLLHPLHVRLLIC